MALTVVLAVGLDSRLLATQTRVWRSAGRLVVSADSIGEAIDLFNDGDFDLVVLGLYISIENRERLTSLIRASGSQTPVAFIGKSSLDSDWFADSTLKNDSSTLLTCLRELLADMAKMQVVPTILHADGSQR
jgi:DNA-binding response OmpR family regulator